MDGIPVFVQQVIGVIVRVAITWFAGWYYAHGGEEYTDSQISNAVIAATPVVAMAIWGIWQRYVARQKQVVSQSAAGLTEKQVEATIKDPSTPNPSVNTPKTEVPQAPPPPPPAA